MDEFSQFRHKKEKEKEDGSVEVSYGRCTCAACGHKWEGVAQVSTYVLECPQCHRMFGMFVDMTYSQGMNWHCNCGMSMFRIDLNGIYCVQCSEYQKGIPL